MPLLVAILINLIAISQCLAITTCNVATIQGAVDAASPGDTIPLDCATGTVDSAINITKALTFQGNGMNSTVLTFSGSGNLNYDLTSGTSRITGIGFTGTTSALAFMLIDGEFTSFRIDNCKFTNLGTYATYIGRGGVVTLADGVTFAHPQQKILIDSNIITNTAAVTFSMLWGQDNAWLSAENYDGNYLTFEDNNLTLYTESSSPTGGFSDVEHGGRILCRNNTITNAQIQFHDTGSTAQSRSIRQYEIYGNLFNCTIGDCGDGAVGLRGGTGFIYGNQIHSDYAQATNSQIYRVDGASPGKPWTERCDNTTDRICSTMRSHCSAGDHRDCGYANECSADGGEGTCVDSCTADSDCPSGSTCLAKFDGQSDASGWPCRDQTGRGIDDPVTHIQASSPTYGWENLNESSTLRLLYSYPKYDDYIKTDRDYYTQKAVAFDGTTGVGCGTLANRPATCTTGVGYWATNQNCIDLTGMVGANPATPISGTFYKCTSTDTWEAYYTPYTYPHPLRGIPTASTSHASGSFNMR